jgi:hypothetical protein
MSNNRRGVCHMIGYFALARAFTESLSEFDDLHVCLRVLLQDTNEWLIRWRSPKPRIRYPSPFDLRVC